MPLEIVLTSVNLKVLHFYVINMQRGTKRRKIADISSVGTIFNLSEKQLKNK